MDGESIYYDLEAYCRKYGEISDEADEALSAVADLIAESLEYGPA